MGCPICGRIYCDHTPDERGQSFEEMMADTFMPVNTEEKSEPKIPQDVLNLIGFIEIQPSDKSGTRRVIVDSLTLNGDVLTLQLSGFQKYVDGEVWTKYDETRELVLTLLTAWRVQITDKGGSPKVMVLFEDGTNYFLFNKSDMKAFNMIGKEITI